MKNLVSDTLSATKRTLRLLSCALVAWLAFLPSEGQAISPGVRYPSNEEQYALQLINQARASANGLSILQGLVTNNLGSITASSSGTSGNGTKWSTGFWKSSIPGVADSMNFYKVHPGDLKRQFMDLVPPGSPLAWNPNLGNVASGYNDLVIASHGSGTGFPHNLSPYQSQSPFAAYVKRYTDGGYGPASNNIYTVGENIAPNGAIYTSALATFAALMIDWGSTANGIQPQDPINGSHRLSLMGTDFLEIGISRKSGWTPGAVTEVQEFGTRFTSPRTIVGAVYIDGDGSGFYTPGEGLGQVTITATPVGSGVAAQTTTYGSGGYALELTAAGTYALTFSGPSGVLYTTTVSIQNLHVRLDVSLPTLNPIPPTPAPARSDFNGDGKTDLVLRHDSGAICVWFMDGVNLLSSAFFNPGQTDPSWKVAGVGDFNQDGKPDLLWRHDSGALAVWFMNGTNIISGTFLNPAQTDPSWKVAGVGDFNQDGKPDLLMRHDGGTICVWFMDGINLLSSTFLNPSWADPQWKIAGIGDFNQDGKPDLVWRHDNGGIGVWFMDGVNQISGSYFNPSATDPSWKISGVGDMNQDGKPDLIWRHESGFSCVWFMDGINLLSSPFLNPGWADPSWKIQTP
jgi:uncharacterized protein YkwD